MPFSENSKKAQLSIKNSDTTVANKLSHGVHSTSFAHAKRSTMSFGGKTRRDGYRTARGRERIKQCSNFKFRMVKLQQLMVSFIILRNGPTTAFGCPTSGGTVPVEAYWDRPAVMSSQKEKHMTNSANSVSGIQQSKYFGAIKTRVISPITLLRWGASLLQPIPNLGYGPCKINIIQLFTTCL